METVASTSLFAELSQVYSSVTMTMASIGSVRASYECFSLVGLQVSDSPQPGLCSGPSYTTHPWPAVTGGLELTACSGSGQA